MRSLLHDTTNITSVDCTTLHFNLIYKLLFLRFFSSYSSFGNSTPIIHNSHRVYIYTHIVLNLGPEDSRESVQQSLKRLIYIYIYIFFFCYLLSCFQTYLRWIKPLFCVWRLSFDRQIQNLMFTQVDFKSEIGGFTLHS